MREDRGPRVNRYLALNHLLALLVSLNLKKYWTYDKEVDLFHKRMGTPENEN